MINIEVNRKKADKHYKIFKFNFILFVLILDIIAFIASIIFVWYQVTYSDYVYYTGNPIMNNQDAYFFIIFISIIILFGLYILSMVYRYYRNRLYTIAID